MEEQRLSVVQRFCERMSFMKYVILVLILPPILNFAALKKESVALIPKQGEQVNVGWGQKLFISCIGSGLPTVILDAPTGGTSDVWYMVQNQLSKVTKVCVYDRAGLGFSDLPFINDYEMPNAKERGRKFVSEVATLEQMSDDLHYLVTEAKLLPRPFILIGSETGALIARHYALMHPMDVNGIILINPLVEDLFWRQKDEWDNYWNSHLLPSLQSLHLSAFVGISRIAALAGWLKPDIIGDSVPEDVEFRQLYYLCNPSHMNAVFHEHLLLNTSFSQMSEIWKTKEFPKNISITIINSKKFDKLPSQLHKAWEESQLHLQQTLHPTCKHRLFDGSLKQLYVESEIIINEAKMLIQNWKNSFETISSVHSFNIQQSLLE